MAGKRPIAGYHVRMTTGKAVCRHLAWRRRHEMAATVFFANTNFVNKCVDLRNEINGRSDVLLLNDGVGLDLASLVFHGEPFSENLNGTDFTPTLLRKAVPGARVFLLGAAPDVVAEVERRLPELTGARVVGARDGYSLWQDETDTVDAINRTGAEVLLVALGNPRQEGWILANRDRLQPPLVIAVGGYFDFVAGKRRRAPHLVQKARLEWLFRLVQEPRRLLRRYSLELVLFFVLCAQARDAEGTRPLRNSAASP